ncbi:MAG: ZIP family metal transporter [Deltaproteobacteria bacterium]|nr:ZIP family metal transporter [Deltaproteobacteria bacterium]
MPPQMLSFGLLAVGLTLAGGAIPVLSRWKEAHLDNFISFSAGVLLATAFLHLLPDALDKISGREAGPVILASFIFLFVLEKFVMLHPCEEGHCDYHTIGAAAFAGMSIHTLFDGFALGASFGVVGLAPLVFMAIMAHKIPSSFTLATILKKGGWPARRILLFIFLFGLIIPLGMVISHSILNSIGDRAVGLALAASLGTFIYIATSDFLPQVHRAGPGRMAKLIAFGLGIALMTAVTYCLPAID